MVTLSCRPFTRAYLCDSLYDPRCLPRPKTLTHPNSFCPSYVPSLSIYGKEKGAPPCGDDGGEPQSKARSLHWALWYPLPCSSWFVFIQNICWGRSSVVFLGSFLLLNLLGTFWPSLIRPVFCAYSNDLSLLFGLLSVYEKGELFWWIVINILLS